MIKTSETLVLMEEPVFSRYVSVLVELSQMEGGTHGGKLAHQMMDVSIR